jgi:Saccharopine dehydrogenase NADP binding domain
MLKRVLIIGGYGNFGGYIARSLAGEDDLQLVIAGRSPEKARAFAARLGAANPAAAAALDITSGFADSLVALGPDIVVHTTGPFQGQNYAVAEAAIARGCHYIDLADARDFVAGIDRFDAAARRKNILVVSGASSVPCLTAAVIDHYRSRFQAIETVEYGITAAQQTNRGLATTAAILSYVGGSFTTLIDGATTTIYGWQDLHGVTYPELGRRYFGNCDIPDLELFPRRYPALRTIRFSAGQEIALLHLGVWGLSWLVRWRLLPRLDRLAPALLKLSFLADIFGSGRSGFHMFLMGRGADGEAKTARFYLIARSGHGPNIPCMPAILLVKGLARGTVAARGARPCLDLIDLDTYLAALSGLDISVVRIPEDG